MRYLATSLVMLLALRMVACGGGGDGGSLPTTNVGGAQQNAATGGTSATGGSGSSTTTGGKSGSSTGGGSSLGGRAGSSGTSVAGSSGSGLPGGTAQVPDIFYDGWNYEVATLYEPGEDPIVVELSGTANFERDRTYVQNYYIGNVLNHYEGTYTIQGDKLQTFDEEGKPVFTYTFTVGEALKELVLTIENDDGSPSIIYGLSSMKK